MLKPSLISASAVAGLVLSSTAFAAPTKPTGVRLSATLTGAAEAPGPGDPNGRGTFSGRLNVGQGQLCYTLTSSNLATLSMAHIHSGQTGKAGPPVVTLTPNAPTSTCISVPKDIAQKLVAAPGDYYVNLHTSDHPNGAIRGQLTKH